MTKTYKSRGGLEIGVDEGTKSDSDKIVYMSKNGLKHYVSLEEIGILLAFKGFNEEQQYPSELGNKGWKKPIDFVRECVKMYIENPEVDLKQLITFLERKHQIVQYSLGIGWERKRTKT